jgi:hypothetical protein
MGLPVELIGVSSGEPTLQLLILPQSHSFHSRIELPSPQTWFDAAKCIDIYPFQLFFLQAQLSQTAAPPALSTEGQRREVSGMDRYEEH